LDHVRRRGGVTLVGEVRGVRPHLGHRVVELDPFHRVAEQLVDGVLAHPLRRHPVAPGSVAGDVPNVRAKLRTNSLPLTIWTEFHTPRTLVPLRRAGAPHGTGSPAGALARYTPKEGSSSTFIVVTSFRSPSSRSSALTSNVAPSLTAKGFRSLLESLF